MFKILICLLFVGLVFISCNQSDQATAPEKDYLVFTGMDSTVRPGDDFYQYVNGKWLKNAIIPSNQFGVGGFVDLYYKNQDVLHSLLDSLSKVSHLPGSIEQKVSDFYAAGMDSTTVEKRGYEPLKPYLSKINGIHNPSDVLQYVSFLQKEGTNIVFNIIIGPDDKSSNVNIAQFGQGGLGLPDRDYYFKKDSASLTVIKAYLVYIETLFRLTGDDSIAAFKKAMEVYNLEKQMAESHRTNVQLRDPQSNYHKMSVQKLNSLMPVFKWESTLKAMDIAVDSVNVMQPAFYARLNKLLASAKPETWKAYLQFHTIDANFAGLTNDFYKAGFDYYYKALSGQQDMKPRWDRIVGAVDNDLGEGLGEIYVNRYFSKEAKARMLELVNNLQTAFDTRITNLNWMSDSTKGKAKDKLHAFIKKIGYPDKPRDYSGVTIDKLTHFENRISCQQNEYRRQIAKLGKPVDKTEWGMTAPTVNAYYNPNFNEIVFPAGYLQPPFFNPEADDAVNYGAIGGVIGHEMTHGFDDQGAQYDKNGNLKNWWTQEDSIKFTARTKALENQYNGFVAIDTFHVNGALTLGENIADLGGLTIAYDAFKLTKQGRDTVRIDGLLPDERFFLSFGFAWENKFKDELLRQWVIVDPHSPSRFRVNGPLENFTPFYTTFNIQKGDKMYKPEADRIKIW
jgi:putative endopeptidase